MMLFVRDPNGRAVEVTAVAGAVEVTAVAEAVLLCGFYTLDFVTKASCIGEEEN